MNTSYFDYNEDTQRSALQNDIEILQSEKADLEKEVSSRTLIAEQNKKLYDEIVSALNSQSKQISKGLSEEFASIL